ncbi:MAG: hypothetical protein IT326_05435, partial [Anaerolineae bacterium]|nr:hypothetical protein [Anaerolineae bacterium]
MGVVLMLASGIIACNLPAAATPAPRPTRTPLPLPEMGDAAFPLSPAPALPAEPPTHIPLGDGWLQTEPGLDARTAGIPTAVGDVEALLIRVDPARYDLRLHYDPANPSTLREWRDRLPEANLIVNGGFFLPDNTTLGLLIIDGERHGFSFDGHGGMLSVYPDNRFEIRWLAEQ